MNLVSAQLKRVGAAVKGFVLRFGNQTAWFLQSLGGTAFDYVRAVGDARSNSIVLACLAWEERTFPEAPSMIYQRQAGSRELTELPDHPLLSLLERPNPYYSGEHLWAATVADRRVTGNAYWIKVRSAQKRVVELYWVPSELMEPRWRHDSNAFIEWYDYSPDGFPTPIPVEDVVHFRIGFDPRNIRKGLSPLYALMREVASDNEAANMSASLLRNMGVPGVIVAPKPGAATISPEDVEVVKAGINQRFSGDRRGEALVLGAPTDVSVLSWSPKQMDMRDLRRLPEERVTACFGVPAIVAGLGAGLDRSTFNNVQEARRMAYESNIIPTQRLLGSEIESQLVSDFGDVATLKFDFDNSKVRVLQVDEDQLHDRARKGWLSGLLPRNRALALIGEEPEEGDSGEIVLIPNNATPMLVTDLLALREMAARVTVPDPNAAVPEPTVDPNEAPPEPADPGAVIRPTGQTNAPKGARVRQLVEAQFDAALADAVLKVLGEEHEGVSAAEHGRTVIREAQKIAAGL